MKTTITVNGYMTVDKFMEFFTRAITASINRYHPTEDHQYHVEDLAVSASIATDAFLYTIEAMPWETKKTK